MNIQPYALPGIKIIPSVEKIKRITAEQLHITGEISNTRRHANIVLYRHLVHYFVRKYHAELTLTDIGMIFVKDHATVLNSIRKIKHFQQWDKEIGKQIIQIESLLTDQN